MTSVSLILPLRSQSRCAASVASATAGVVRGSSGISALECDWRALAATARDGAPFLNFAFAVAAAHYHEARGERVLTATVMQSGRLVCALPIAVARRSGIKVAMLLGDPFAQYGDVLLAREVAPRLCELALRELARAINVDVLEFRRVRDGSALMSALCRFARPTGPILEAPFLDLANGRPVEDLLHAIGGAKQRRERARSRRRLAEQGALGFEVRRGAEACEWVRDAVEMKRRWLAAAGHASPVIDDPEFAKAFARVAKDPRDGRCLVATRLGVGGRPAAYEIGLVQGARYHAFLGVVAGDFAAASPGKILMEETFRWCGAQGLETIDLLPPADHYKRLWSNGSVPVRDHVRPVTIAGALYAGLWLETLRPRLRAALGRLPASLRRKVGAAALKAGAR
ncbi:GNAT family N-acetyltransferase [Hansschlegelia zhihuaiae]|nr:GNAT family N-acetyltransferase [Hansschlegelia zhihuaiae]